VASAGSILKLSRIRGIKVPNKAAKSITANNELLTVRVRAKESLTKKL
jgi:hypothetical protein